MSKKFKKGIKIFLITFLLLIIGFIIFILNETKDQVNANLSNVEEKLNQFYNPKRMSGFAVSVFNIDSILFSKGFGYTK